MTSANEPQHQPDLYFVIPAVMLGVMAGNAAFHVTYGQGPPPAMARPIWFPLAFGAFALMIATREKGSARIGFIVWALYYILVAFTPLSTAGWGAWLGRTSILVAVSSALVASASPISGRDRGIFAAVVFATMAVIWTLLWSGRRLFLG